MANCTFCQKKFDLANTKTPNKLFCSKACWSKNRRILGLDLIEKTCVICEEKFMADKSKHKNRQTCSRSCGNYFAWEQGKGKLKDMKLKARHCQQCNKEFFSKDKVVKYCSYDCVSLSRIERNKLKPKQVKFIKCQSCGKDHSNKKFCSVTCARIARKKIDKSDHTWVRLNKLIKKISA